MNRRRFLQALGIGAAALVAGAELDLERLLWVPKPIVTVPDMSASKGFKIGDRITIRLPQRYRINPATMRSYDPAAVGDYYKQFVVTADIHG